MKGRILIADDEPTVLDAVARYLERMGYDVDTAIDAKHALSLFSKNPYDVLITDLVMPDLNGIELIDRANRIDPDVPKIIVTGLGTLDDAVAAIRKGAYDYLEKPFRDFAQLAVTVSRALEKRRLLLERREMQKHLEATNRSLAEHVDELESARTRLAEQAASLAKANEVIQDQYRLLEQDLLIARRIQQEMLPKAFPTAPGVSFAGYYFPSNRVGGDFYDANRVSDRHIGFYIADVAGHGVGSAMITVFLKQTIVERLLTTRDAVPITPDDVLKELNARLGARRLPKSMFLTAWYGLYDTQTGLLRYAAGGHTPILLVRPDGAIKRLASQDIALGWTTDATYAGHEVSLAAGDRLVLYTDGITNQPGPDGTPLGLERLERIVSGVRGQSADAIARTVLEELDAYAGDGSPTDDVSIVVLAVDGGSDA